MAIKKDEGFSSWQITVALLRKTKKKQLQEKRSQFKHLSIKFKHFSFGGNVEDSMGPRRFVAFYLLCGLVAAVAQIISNPASAIPMVGASGAIGGVMGAYILLYPRIRVHMVVFLGFFVTTFAVPAVFMLGYWLLIQVFSGVASLGAQGGGVAFWAHVGGFMSGAILILFFRDKTLLALHPYHGWQKQSGPTKNWQRVSRR